MKFRASILCFVCLALVLCCISPDFGVEAQTTWTKYTGNPILLHGADFDWDWFIFHPNVIQEPTGYKMWFTAQTYTMGFELRMRIGLATAPDKVTWTKHPSNPVMGEGSPGSWEEYGAFAPWILPDVTGYKMWYSGMRVGMSPQIGYATSPDGVTWTKFLGNPVIPMGPPGEWNGNGTSGASVLFIGGTYHAWYTGTGFDGLSRIGYATSVDGTSWADFPVNPVLNISLPGNWDSVHVGLPHVLFNGTEYEMWYTGQDGSGYGRIGYATSPDGINWTKYAGNPVLSEGDPGDWDEQGFAGASIIAVPPGYDMWFGGLSSGGDTGMGYANDTSAVNHPPRLVGGEVTPLNSPRNSRFTYNVAYDDEDNDPPTFVRVWINNSGIPFSSSPYDLKFGNWKGAPDDWVAGANYSLSVNLFAEGSDYTFAFSASDGEESVFLPKQAGPNVTGLFGVEKIVFHSTRTGNWDIWKMDADGGNLVQLTTDPREDRFPGWSPDAERITYANVNGTDYDVWVMDADGSNETPLTTHPSDDTDPVWSPDGTKIAFTSSRDGDFDIWVMDSDGTNKVQLTTNISEDTQPTWSPDGSRIAFASDRMGRNIWVMDADGSNQTEIQSDSGWDIWPSWSPDGTRIALTADRLDEGYDIWTMDPNGGNQTQLTANIGGDSCPCWSPDSSRVAYNSVLTGYVEIWIMERDGSNKTPLTSNTAIDACPDMTIEPVDTPPLPPVMQSAVLVGGNHEDVLITWNASADEGQAGGTMRYEVRRSTAFVGPYSYMDEVTANWSSNYAYIDIGAGHGDPSNYFYRVYSINMMDNENVTEEAAGKFVRGLQAGLNFISIPLRQADESLATVLQTVPVDRAWHYDSLAKDWMYYVSFKQYKTSLDLMDHRKGLWIETPHASNLTVAGIVSSQTTISHRKGWNLVSFPSFNASYAVSDLMADAGATRVEGYDPGSPYCLRVLNPAEVLLAGEAYWVRVDADVDWIVEAS
ncbi:MAG: hypothetical protein V3V98_01155 [Thermoplasmata archaeon]